MILYHGAHTSYRPHEGQCYTDDADTAERYARMAGARGVVATVELPDSLTVERCDGYDHGTNDAPADREDYRRAAAERGVDVLVYEDEDEMGRVHDCYRIVTERALAALRVLETEEA